MHGRLTNVQLLRALAAIFVVLSHAAHETFGMAQRIGAEPIFHQSTRWTAAVDVFFVMSGFILLSTSYNSFAAHEATVKFFTRRLVRAIPLYWLLTTLVLVGGLLAPALLNVPITDLGHVVSSYLFWPSPRENGEIRPVLALGWTMNLEFFFYGVLAICLALPRRWGVVAATGALVGVVALAQLMPAPGMAISFWGSFMTLDFVLGFAIALAYQAGIRISASAAWTTCALAVADIAISASTEPGAFDWFVTISLPAGALVAAGVLAPQVATVSRLPRFGVLLGDACYSTYLLQPFILRPAAVAWVALVGAGAPLWAFVGLAAALALGGGLACFLLFEKPLTAVLNRHLKNWERRREARALALQPAE